MTSVSSGQTSAQSPEAVDEDRVQRAAHAAGQWWAARMRGKHIAKRDAFAAAITTRVAQELRGECYWDWRGERHEGVGYEGRSRTEFDYDLHNLLIPAWSEATGLPDWESKDGFPTKHTLDVTLDKMFPKEGYGNWTPDIDLTSAPFPEPSMTASGSPQTSEPDNTKDGS